MPVKRRPRRRTRTRQSRWASVPKEDRSALKARVFARDGYRCQIKGPRCTGVAQDLDHIVPADVDPERMLDESNCRASCIVCNRGHHRRMTADPSRDW